MNSCLWVPISLPCVVVSNKRGVKIQAKHFESDLFVFDCGLGVVGC